MSKALYAALAMLALAVVLGGAPAHAEFIKRVICQDQHADSLSSDTEVASTSFQQWVTCVNGR